MEKKAQDFLEEQKLLNPGKTVQVWFQDEARFGQKGIVTRIWGLQGCRPTLPRQNGFKSSYFIGAVRPATGDKHALLFDGLDSRVISFYLDDFGRRLPKYVQAVMVVDGAGWHSAEELTVPKNITLLRLPPYSPELNPIEQVWGYLKSNFFVWKSI
ncbi:MAG: IS630 family transposase [Bdellovibrionales bacterium]|nr:IS630 family transposase [Bdellovibrionales bacterium]